MGLLINVASFDKSAWIDRAWRKKKSVARLRSDIRGIRGLESVVRWCEERGLEVEFKRVSGGEYDPENSRILVSSAAKPETQLFILLHECGHHLFESSATARAQVAQDARKGSIAYTVNHLAEEFEAWARARKLADRLKVPLDESFERYRVRCLNTYIEWAADRGRGYDD